MRNIRDVNYGNVVQILSVTQLVLSSSTLKSLDLSRFLFRFNKQAMVVVFYIVLTKSINIRVCMHFVWDGRFEVGLLSGRSDEKDVKYN